MTEEAEIIFAIADGLAKVVLNRPKALNALTHEMCVAFDAKLKQWAADPRVKALLIRGQGSRAFCAGGDIRKLYDEGRAGGRYPFDFYRDEYRTNARIHHFPKPYIALLDGIVMGGGVGFSVHGSHRVVTENTLFAMPETGIGLFPDVGGSYFLARCPGQLGMYLGLTGERIKAADALYAGVGDYYVPAAELAAMEQALRDVRIVDDANSAVSTVIARFASDPGLPSLPPHRAMIDRIFALPSVEAILAALRAEPGEFAARVAATIAGKSPTSLKITFRQIREGGHKGFDDCMRMEWRMANRVIRGHDFYEGTRAAVIDKDRKPAWRPDRLEALSTADIDTYFAPLPAGDLDFEWE